VLRRLHGGTPGPDLEATPALGFDDGGAQLARNTVALLGPEPPRRSVRIMVTMPSRAADDPLLVHDLLASGMDVMRIDCGRDGQVAWQRMIAHLRRAEEAVARGCRVFMDLAGPHLRTGPVEPGPQAVSWEPRRDALGRVVEPAQIWLTGMERGARPRRTADAVLPVPDAWLATVDIGDQITLTDARGRKRTLEVMTTLEHGRWATCERAAYVAAGTPLRVKGRRKRDDAALGAAVGDLPAAEQTLPLRPGDTLVLTRAQAPGRPAQHDAAGHVVAPATIPCTLPVIFADVRPGEAIWLDDGRIGGVIDDVDEQAVRVRITQAQREGSPLRGGRAINLPESTLRLPALTPQDVEHLRFVAAHADLVGLSFIRHPAAMDELQSHLAQLGADLGIVLKIETRSAFEQLPQLLLAAMRSRLAGVMIGRGGLAVECGYERLAEVQEEVLWLSEAAHVPVIWATEVLETLAQTGQATRAEITDAAMAERAEGVLLNDGPFVVEATHALDDILTRMQAHQSKKVSLLRPLRSWPLRGNFQSLA
jgi:pyruvate kinase